MNKIVPGVCTLISVVLYYNVPLQYDRTFCLTCLLVFFVEAYLIIRHDMKHINLLNFNILFFLTFFLCTFVYPVFLVGQSSIVGMLIESRIPSFNTINKCVALSTLAVSVYSLAYSIFRRSTTIRLTQNEKDLIPLLFPRIKLLFIPIILTMLLILGIHLTKEHDGNEVDEAPYLFQLFYFLLPMFVVSGILLCVIKYEKEYCLSIFFKSNKLIFFFLIIIITLFLLIGDRFPILVIVVAFLASISLFIKQISWHHLLVGFFIGVMLMFALRVTRQGDDSISVGGVSQFVSATKTSVMDNVSPWDIFADLVGINIELNTGMDYVNREGNLFPTENLVIHVTSPVPFLPTILSQKLFNISAPKDIASGIVIGEYINYTAGNHCVIDVYMPYGIIGVCVLFFLFGMLNGKVSNGLKTSLFCKTFYVYLVSFSIFIVRNSIINLYRALVLSFITFYILTLISRKQRKRIN